MNTIKNLFKGENLIFIVIIIVSLIILLFSVRGLMGVPKASELNSSIWKQAGPFELSPERGRYSLLYSLIEDNSFQFSNNIGQFAEPDVAVSKGRYVSLFAPLVSYVVVPGYLIGKILGASQVGTFLIISLFAIFNLILIKKIIVLLGGKSLPALIAGFSFLFATPAYAYAVNLYQHHISTFLILLGIYMLLKPYRIWRIAMVFFLCSLAIPLDYPNLFFLMPIVFFALSQIFNLEKFKNRLRMNISLQKVSLLLVIFIPLLFFMLFNYYSYGNPLQISGTLQTVENLNQSNKNTLISDLSNLSQKPKVKKSLLTSFNSRDMLNGFYILFISPDRGVIYYAPVMLFGVVGIIVAYNKRIKLFSLLLSIMGANILLYSMWGDPWGGWAFGPRYLIPTFAILSIFCGLAISNVSKKLIFKFLFFIVGIYSLVVNALGAITTSAIPPQVQVLELEKISGVVQRYTYQRNWEFLLAGNSKSFIFQTFFQNSMTALEYFQILAGLIITIFTLLIILLFANKRKELTND